MGDLNGSAQRGTVQTAQMGECQTGFCGITYFAPAAMMSW